MKEYIMKYSGLAAQPSPPQCWVQLKVTHPVKREKPMILVDWTSLWWPGASLMKYNGENPLAYDLFRILLPQRTPCKPWFFSIPLHWVRLRNWSRRKKNLFLGNSKPACVHIRVSSHKYDFTAIGPGKKGEISSWELGRAGVQAWVWSKLWSPVRKRKEHST